MWRRSAVISLMLATATGSACGRSTSGVEPAAGEAGETASGASGGRGAASGGSAAGATGGRGGQTGGGSGGGGSGIGGGSGGDGPGGTGEVSGSSGISGSPSGGGGGASGAAASGGSAAGSSAGEAGGFGPPGCVLRNRSCGSQAVGFECPPEIYYDPPDTCTNCIDPTMENLQCYHGQPCTPCCCEPSGGGCEAQTGTCVGYPSTPNLLLCIEPYEPPAQGCITLGSDDGVETVCCP